MKFIIFFFSTITIIISGRSVVVTVQIPPDDLRVDEPQSAKPGHVLVADDRLAVTPHRLERGSDLLAPYQQLGQAHGPDRGPIELQARTDSRSDHCHGPCSDCVPGRRGSVSSGTPRRRRRRRHASSTRPRRPAVVVRLRTRPSANSGTVVRNGGAHVIATLGDARPRRVLVLHDDVL